jgi:hypothetical protein
MHVGALSTSTHARSDGERVDLLLLPLECMLGPSRQTGVTYYITCPPVVGR